jgi:pimeloyl-ACP methyl ester carboxylesterase
VLLIPGFLAGDSSLGVLKRYLTRMVYQAETWGLGRNTGRSEHLFDYLPERLHEMAAQAGEPVSLIGQSLGGVFGRELARQYPDQVRQVITMGSPFGAKNSAVTMRALTHLYKASSGDTVHEMLSMMQERRIQDSPDVPVTAIYSKGDGVVHWRACREMVEDHKTQNVEIIGSHCGMGFNPAIYYILADRLAQNPDSWSRFGWGC